MFKHIIWDFDGTLFDAYPVMAKAMVKVLKDNEITETYDNIFKLMKVSYPHLKEYLRDKYNIGESFLKEYDEVRTAYEKEYIQPFDGIKEICKRIADEGKCNHLFTHRGSTAIDYLKKFDMLDDFTELITKESGFERKPSPNGINYLIEKYNMNKAHAIMIGDRELDLMSGKNAGISSCYFNNGTGHKLGCADYIIEKFDELYPVIFKG